MVSGAGDRIQNILLLGEGDSVRGGAASEGTGEERRGKICGSTGAARAAIRLRGRRFVGGKTADEWRRRGNIRGSGSGNGGAAGAGAERCSMISDVGALCIWRAGTQICGEE